MLRQQAKSGIVRRAHLPDYFTFVPNDGDLKNRVGKYVHNEKTKVVKDMATMFINGTTARDIALHLNGKKIKTFKEKKEWQRNTVARVLSNQILTGEFNGNPNYAPPIVTKDEFEIIKYKLASCKSNKGRKSKHSFNIFRGLAFCKCCNATMSPLTGFGRKKEIYRYLRCCSAEKGKTCENQLGIRIEDFEAELFVHCLYAKPETLLENDGEDDLKTKAEISRKENELKFISDKIKNLLALDGSLGMAEIKEGLEAAKAQREKIAEELTIAKGKMASKNTGIQSTAEFKKMLEKELGSDNIFNLNNLYSEVLESLKDNNKRKKLHTILGKCLEKIVVDSYNGKFYVYNKTGKMIYESMPYTD